MLPTLVAGLVNQMVVDVAASETHTAALTADGELYTWGRDRFGQVRCLFFVSLPQTVTNVNVERICH